VLSLDGGKSTLVLGNEVFDAIAELQEDGGKLVREDYGC
jgi:hypothetical protein